MKKGFYILFIFLIAFGKVFGQTNSYTRADSIILTNKTKTAVLVIQNATKDTTGGFLKNIGKGVTKFDKVKISDIKGLSDSLSKRIFFSQNFKYADSVLDLADSIRIAKAILIGSGNHFKIKDTLTFTKFSGSNNILITNPSTYINVTKSAPSSGGRMYTFGNSIPAGAAASDTLHAYPHLIAKHFGYLNSNYSISGSTLEKRSPINPYGGTNLIDLISNIPHHGINDKLFIIDYAVNDWQVAGTNYNPTNYQTDANRVIDTLVARGWTTSQILIISTEFVNPSIYGTTGVGGGTITQANQVLFDNASQTIASSRGCLFFNANSYMGSRGGIILLGNTIHPNNLGHATIAQGIIHLLDSVVYQQNQVLAINGISEFNRIRLKNPNTIKLDAGMPMGIDSIGGIRPLSNLPFGFIINYPTMQQGFYQANAAIPNTYSKNDFLIKQDALLTSALDDQAGTLYNSIKIANGGGGMDFFTNFIHSRYKFYGIDGTVQNLMIDYDGSLVTSNGITAIGLPGHTSGDIIVPQNSGLYYGTGGVYGKFVPFDNSGNTVIGNSFNGGKIKVLTSLGVDATQSETSTFWPSGVVSIQVGRTPIYNPAAILSLNSTKQGFLPPRLSQAQRDSLGYVQYITPSNFGSSYTSVPTITLTGGGGTGATATAILDSTLHQIVSYIVTNIGTGYTTSPTVTVTGGGGSSAAANATITFQNNPGLIIYNTTTNKLNYWNSTQWVAIDSTGTGGSGVTSVTGTTNRITSTGGLTPVIDISSTFEALLEKVANKSTTTTLGTSNTLYPTQNAVKVYVDNAISGLTTPSLQSVATVGNSYTGHIQMQALEVTGTTGTGYADMISQSASPSSTSGHIKIYSDSLNRLSWKNPTYRRTLQVPYPSDYTARFPYRVTGTTLEDSTHAATTYQAIGTYLTPSSTNVVTNKDLSSLTNVFPTFTAAAGTLTGTTLNSTVVSSSLTSANLAALTATDATLTFSGSYNGNNARTVGINLANSNTFTSGQTVSISSLGTTNGNGFTLINPTTTTSGVTIQNSPSLLLGSRIFNTGTSSDNSANVQLYVSPVSAASPTLFNFRIDASANGAAFGNILNLNSFGSLTTTNYTAISSNAGTSTSTLGIGLTNSSPSTSGATVQNSTVVSWHGSNWNTTATAAANYFDWKVGARGTSAATPATTWVLSSSQGTSSTTPSYTDRLTVDNGGNLTMSGAINSGGGFQGTGLNTSGNGQTLSLQTTRTYSSAMTAVNLLGGSVTNSTGQYNGVSITNTFNQTSTAGGTDFTINRTNTAIGSGNQYFIDAQVSASSKFHVDYKGSIVSNGTLSFANPTAGTLGTDSILVHNSGGQVKVISANSYSLVAASNDITAQTAAGNITTVTSAASNSTYDVGGYINVTAIATDVIQAQVTFTDENNTSQTISLASISAIGFNSIGVQTIRVKASTTITLKTNLTTGVGTITFDAGGYIKKDY